MITKEENKTNEANEANKVIKVSEVNDLDKKSFKNYTGPTDGFKSKNLFFGYNGQGKSALALGVIEEFKKRDGVTENNYRFFNNLYVEKNLMLNDSEDIKIKGVIANFGEKLVNIEKEILETEAKIIDTNALKDEESEIDKDILNEIDNIFNNKKGSQKIRRITKDDSLSLIEAYEGEIANATKYEPSIEKLKDIDGSGLIQSQLDEIQNFDIDEVKEEVSTIDDIFTVLKKEFKESGVPSFKLLEWIKSGLEIHSDGDDCKFCHGNLNYKKLLEDVEIYNNDKTQLEIKKMNAFLTYLDNLNDAVDKVVNIEQRAISLIGPHLAVNYEEIKSSQPIIASFKKVIKDKMEDITSKSDFDIMSYKSAIKNIVLNIATINQSKTRRILELTTMNEKMNTLIKGAVALEIRNNTFIKENVKSLKKIKQEILDATNANSAREVKIQELKKMQTNKKDFADHISTILKQLEVNLELELFDGNYLIKHSIDGKKLTLSEISVGEKNLLALLYFYYELFDDKNQKEFKTEIELVVIDDPISSVDDNNKNYILILLTNLLKNKSFQFFLFTHVWDDFYNLSRRTNKEITSFFEIHKNSKGSFVNFIPETKIEKPYKHEFKEIYNFSKQKDDIELDNCQIYHYPNVMRKILEEFLTFKISKFTISQGSLDKISDALCDNKPTEIDKQRIAELINICNHYSHSIEKKPTEIRRAAKYLMDKIKSNDKIHYDTNKQ
jgi:wobble nucleotide-excising tRNase